MNVTLSGKRAFADIIKDLKMISLSGWALNPMTGVLIREKRRRHRREGHVKTEAETGVMNPQTKGRNWKTQGGFFLRAFGESTDLPTT